MSSEIQNTLKKILNEINQHFTKPSNTITNQNIRNQLNTLINGSTNLIKLRGKEYIKFSAPTLQRDIINRNIYNYLENNTSAADYSYGANPIFNDRTPACDLSKNLCELKDNYKCNLESSSAKFNLYLDKNNKPIRNTLYNIIIMLFEDSINDYDTAKKKLANFITKTTKARLNSNNPEDIYNFLFKNNIVHEEYFINNLKSFIQKSIIKLQKSSDINIDDDILIQYQI